MSEPDAGTYLTVSEAAAALKVSERTIQRRCKSGTLSARLVSGEDGQQWQIAASEVPTLPTEVPTAAAIAADKVPTRIEHKSEAADSLSATSGGTLPTGAAIAADSELTAQLMAEKDARIEDLKAQVLAQRLQLEAAHRSNAEISAVLRALATAPKALNEGGQVLAADGNRPKLGQVGTENARELEQVGTDSQVLAEDVNATPEPARFHAQNDGASKVTADAHGVRNSGTVARRRGFRGWLLEILNG